MMKRPRNRPAIALLGTAFGALALVLLASSLVAYVRFRQAEANVDAIGDDALVRIGLVEKMGMDLLRERDLVYRHILEDSTEERQRTEVEIAATEASFAAAAQRYAPLATFPGEADAWHRLQAHVTDIERPIGGALALSRQNQDARARAALTEIEPKFRVIEQDLESLVAINQTSTARARDKMKALRQSVMRLGVGLAGLAFALTLGIGVVVIGLVSRRDNQIRRYTTELEERNRELDAFAGRVAHDLRGPLTTISLSADRFSERVPQEQATADILRRGVARMERLIADLLKLSRIDAQLPGMTAQIADAVASIAHDLAPRLEEVGGAMRVGVQPAVVGCSEGLLREVLSNLAENALKYRRSDVPLTVAIIGRSAADRYELRVEDNGSGMSPEVAQRAFEPFFRGEQAHSAPGTGLGLSIVKRIVEVSGGNIRLETRPREGTTFFVTFLRRTARSAPET